MSELCALPKGERAGFAQSGSSDRRHGLDSRSPEEAPVHVVGRVGARAMGGVFTCGCVEAPTGGDGPDPDEV